jgi:hypothetical protein
LLCATANKAMAHNNHLLSNFIGPSLAPGAFRRVSV